MAFRTYRSGVSARVREFLTRLPHGSEVYWVTFTLDPTQEILDAIADRDLHVTVICRHPSEAFFGSSIFSVDAWQRIKASGAIHKIYGLRDPSYADGEHDFGFLHAKYIVAKHAGQKNDYSLLTGSFNLAKGSLDDNFEHCHDTINENDTLQAWRDAQELVNVALEITSADQCNDWSRIETAVLEPRDGPARVPPRAVARASKRPPAKEPYRPDDLRLLAEALDAMLCDWPPQGPNRQWQWDVFCDLQSRDEETDLLYLPVGVGKTFIALRWLLWRINEAGAERSPSPGLFLAPNLWAAMTARRDASRIEQAAGLIAEKQKLPAPHFDRYVKICNAVRAREIRNVSALVADEVHNWNPKGTTSEAPNYTEIVNRWRGEVPVLGVSATPCRVDSNGFEVKSFVRAFLGRKTDETTHAGLGLRQAIDMKLLSRPRYERLASDVQEDVAEVLRSDDGTVIRFGEYGKATLRRVWDVLAGTPAAIRRRVTEICDAIRKRQARRVVVFLPPVEEAADGFVRALERAMTSAGCPFFDFRSSATESESKAREVFKEFADKRVAPGRPAVIVTIDRLAEGISVPDIDMLVMLRATLSPRVAVQALGRGLRRAAGKTECAVLDAVQLRERLQLWELNVFDDADISPRPSLRSDNSPVEVSTVPEDWDELDLELLAFTVADLRKKPRRHEELAKILRLSVPKLREELEEQHGHKLIASAFGEPAWVRALDRADEVIDEIGAHSVQDVRRELDDGKGPLVEQLVMLGFSRKAIVETVGTGINGRTRLDNVMQFPERPTTRLLEHLVAELADDE